MWSAQSKVHALYRASRQTRSQTKTQNSSVQIANAHKCKAKI